MDVGRPICVFLVCVFFKVCFPEKEGLMEPCIPQHKPTDAVKLSLMYTIHPVQNDKAIL